MHQPLTTLIICYSLLNDAHMGDGKLTTFKQSDSKAAVGKCIRRLPAESFSFTARFHVQDFLPLMALKPASHFYAPGSSVR
jgi:hypothetical protein